MLLIPLYIIVVLLVIYLTAATLYLFILAAAFFVVPEPKRIEPARRNRFAILVPAHNEEMLIARLCESLLRICYPKELYEIFIIADNCTDKTSEICNSFPIKVLTRIDALNVGKGYAIDWALGRLDLENFDAVLIVDADNIVDINILEELNLMVEKGEQAIQCYNAVGNRDDSWFTQLLFISRTIGNVLYHHAKYKLGLSSYLMGNGICFSTKLLKMKGWTAFSIGEDWEYYTRLIVDRVKIGFAVHARVFHQESKSLQQATTQRLRWSSGRYFVLRKYGVRLFWKGLIKRNLFTLDASFPLIFPNYSLQINLTFLSFILTFFLPHSFLKVVFLTIISCLFLGQVMLFLVGAFIAKSYKKTLIAILCAPFFLIWKAIIDVLSFTGLYRGDKWIRTQRHISKS